MVAACGKFERQYPGTLVSCGHFKVKLWWNINHEINWNSPCLGKQSPAANSARVVKTFTVLCRQDICFMEGCGYAQLAKHSYTWTASPPIANVINLIWIDAIIWQCCVRAFHCEALWCSGEPGACSIRFLKNKSCVRTSQRLQLHTNFMTEYFFRVPRNDVTVID